MVETALPVATTGPDRVRHPGRGYVYLVVAAALFAFNGTVSKVILDAGMSAPRLTQLRCTGAAVGLLLVLLVVAPHRIPLSRREIPLLAAYGIAGVALTQCFYFVAIARMPVSIALLLEYTAPLMVALWARFVFRQPVRSRVWAALGLSLVGLALVAEVWQGSTLDGIGVAAALVAAVALAAYYLLGEHSASSATRSRPPSGRSSSPACSGRSCSPGGTSRSTRPAAARRCWETSTTSRCRCGR